MPEGGSKTSTMPVVWANFAIFFGAIKMIFSRDWWPWTKPGYITMTRRQSYNQWSGGIAAHSAPPPKKNSERKNPLETFSSWFFGIKTAPSSLIIFQRAKLSTRSFTHHCWRNWRTFWRENAAEISQRLSCSCTTMFRIVCEICGGGRGKRTGFSLSTSVLPFRIIPPTVYSSVICWPYQKEKWTKPEMLIKTMFFEKLWISGRKNTHCVFEEFVKN